MVCYYKLWFHLSAVKLNTGQIKVHRNTWADPLILSSITFILFVYSRFVCSLIGLIRTQLSTKALQSTPVYY